jgi:hypothetical protein
LKLGKECIIQLNNVNAKILSRLLYEDLEGKSANLLEIRGKERKSSIFVEKKRKEK